MGRLVRRYIRVFDLTVRNSIELGTSGSPITQFEAGQTVVSVAIDATALGGNVYAGYFRVNATVDMSGYVTGLRAVLNIETGIDVTTGFARGLHVSTDMAATSSVEYGWDGIYISMSQNASAVSSGNNAAITARTTMAGTLGIFYFMYLQENICALMTGGFYVRCIDMDNLFYLFPTVTTGWAQTGNPSNQNGWIKVSLAGNIRWIMLYSTAP